MRRPPDGVVFVARTHGFVGLVILTSLLPLYFVTRQLPAIEFGARTYGSVTALGAFYLGTALLVWRGSPLGPALSRVCCLLYLPRPAFGARLWETMNTPEFRGHFRRAPQPADGGESSPR